jgi:hypothetical protein
MFDGAVAGLKLRHLHRPAGLDRLAAQMLIAALVLKVSVTGVTYFVLANGGSELNPLSQVSLPYCLESFLATGVFILGVAVFVRVKGYRLILYSFALALASFDLAWDVTQAFQLPIFEGIVMAAFVTASIPTIAALHVQLNQEIYGR